MLGSSGIRRAWPWAALILALTLTPGDGGGGSPSVFCVLCGGNGGADLVLNVLLFVPLGFALARDGRAPWRVLAACAALSTGIELAQLLLPDRSPTLRDIVTNAIGGALGAAAFRVLPQFLARGRAATAALGAATVLPAGTAFLTAQLLGPTIQPIESLQVIWSPEYARRGNRWSGRVEAVTLGSVALPRGHMRVSPGLQAAIGTGAPLRIAAVTGTGDERYMPVLRLAPVIDESLIIVAVAKRSVIIFPRRAAADLRLRSPGARFDGVLDGIAPGSPVALTVSPWTGARPCITVNAATTCADPPHAARGWAFLLPERGSGPTTLDLLTLAALFLPVSMLAPLRGRVGYGIAVTTATLGFVVVRGAAGFAAFTLLDAAVAIATLAIGAYFHRARHGDTTLRGVRALT